MSKVVTIRIADEHYRRIKLAAGAENRSVSNFLETAALRWLEQVDFVDEREMHEIREDRSLINSLKAGSEDYRKGRYTVVRNRRDRRVS